MSRNAVPPPDDRPRCGWVTPDPVYHLYHDTEWGVPVHDERRHFEFLVLDGAQAGLSWLTILRKREAYRQAFAGFDPEEVARFDEAKIRELLANPGIVRNRLKVEGAVRNARAFLSVQETFGSFDAFIWRFVEGETLQNSWESLAELPPRTPLSDAVSREMKRLGFTFVGSVICYSYMQAAGLVNDHLRSCFRHAEVASLARTRN